MSHDRLAVIANIAGQMAVSPQYLASAGKSPDGKDNPSAWFARAAANLYDACVAEVTKRYAPTSTPLTGPADDQA